MGHLIAITTRRHRMAGLAAGLALVAVVLAWSSAMAYQSMDTAAAAHRLVPLLQDIRQRMQPGIGVRPGALPPSPFSGRQSTLLAFSVGKGTVSIDPRVAEAIDRLVAWKIDEADQSEDAVLFSHWLDQLSLQIRAFQPAGESCDTACVAETLSAPGERFGSSAADRQATRDKLLLDALGAAVDALG